VSDRPLTVGEKITGLVRGEFFCGKVRKLWERGFVWDRGEETTQVLNFLHNEGVTWMRGEATLNERKAMKAAVALRDSK
jgi:hypothetical protein